MIDVSEVSTVIATVSVVIEWDSLHDAHTKHFQNQGQTKRFISNWRFSRLKKASPLQVELQFHLKTTRLWLYSADLEVWCVLVFLDFLQSNAAGSFPLNVFNK